METIRMTMAQALVKFLDNQYVEYDGVENKFVEGIFGIFGHGNAVGIGQALEESDDCLHWHQSINEQGGGFAAISFAKMKNRKAIYACSTSIGPGATNLVTAAASATVNRIPLLCLVSDVFISRQPDPVLQQVENFADYTITANDTFRPVSRYWDRIVRPDQLMSAALHAMRVLTDPELTGAVTLCLPQDVQGEAYDYPVEFFKKRVHHICRRIPTDGEIERLVELVRSKKRPMFVVGGGLKFSEADQELKALASKYRIPITETYGGKGGVSWDDKFNLGAVGDSGTRSANKVAREADLVIGVGTRFTDFSTASRYAFRGEGVEFVSINVSGFDACKLEALPVIADAKLTIQRLTAELDKIGYSTDYAEGEIEQLHDDWSAEIARISAARLPDRIPQTAALGTINDCIPEDAIITAAAGTLPACLQRMWRVKTPYTYNMEYGYSAMGYEVAGALGAKMAHPDKEVYAVTGDGSYMMLNGELFSSIRYKKKVTIIVMNNNGHQCIHDLQWRNGQEGYGCQFRTYEPETNKFTGPEINVDYSMHAASYGCKTYRVWSVEELKAAIEDAKKQEISCLIEVMTLKGTWTSNYDGWWRLGMAEVSKSERVQAVYQDQYNKIQVAKKY